MSSKVKTNGRPINYSFRRVSLEWAWHVITNILRVKILRSNRIRPILVSYNVTHECNMKCDYCGYIKEPIEALDTEGVKKVLKAIRPGHPALNITGGEPLVRPDIVEILAEARRLNFAPIVLNTNGLLLPKKEEVLYYADYVIISLDSLNEKHWDQVVGVEGATSKVKSIIAHYAKLQNKFQFEMNINCVITPSTMNDVLGVLEFCDRVGVNFSPGPQIDGTEPNPEFPGNAEYRKLLSSIINHKKDKKPVLSTMLYLHQVSDFLPHRCYPMLVPKINPDGSVFYPCVKLGKVVGNLATSSETLDMVLTRAARQDPLVFCDNNCHMSCYLEPANYIEHPFLLLQERHLRLSRPTSPKGHIAI
jgi:MoaA/NifB/PqqE/SkfB family radical SAM enzyme